MLAKFCSKCGAKLIGGSNFCPNCGEATPKSTNNRQVAQQISGNNLFYYIGIVLIALFSANFYGIWYLLTFKWERVTAMLDVYYDSPFGLIVLIFVGYLLGVIIFSILFSKSKASNFFVKITFLASLIAFVGISLHFLATTIVYIFNEQTFKQVSGSYPGGMNALVEHSKSVLAEKLMLLLINLLAVIGFILFLLYRYFKDQSLDFVTGVKSIISKPFSTDRFINIFKHLN